MMNKTRGIVVLAQNNETTDYVQQACLLALSLKFTNSDCKISIITDDSVSAKYKNLFDEIINIPWNDAAIDTEWKIENRWKLYHCSPYDQTIVMDTDMLVLQDISTWWTFLSNYEVFFTTKVHTYRGDEVTGDYYRKAFVNNNLPNLYSGFHYFEKSDFALEFYTWLELVVQNWQKFYEIFIKHDRPTWCSIDVCTAIVTLILNCEDKISNKIVKFPSFTHMKPNIQNWYSNKAKWKNCVDVYLDNDLQLKLGNHQQTGILHYTENDFVKPHMLASYYKELYNAN